MLTIVADYPLEDKAKDGMAQRVLAIDDMIANSNRNYLQISYRGNFKKQKYTSKTGLNVFKLNFFIHFFTILFLLKRSKLVYFHSIYNSAKCLAFISMVKFVIDVHGIVPEENNMKGRPIRAKIFNFVEMLTLKYAEKVIVVTNNMCSHLEKKHNISLSEKKIVLPIFGEIRNENRVKQHSKDISVVYVGGCQVWQNIDLMMSSILRLDDARFKVKLFFPKKDVDMIFSSYPTLSNCVNVVISSANPEEVPNILMNADLGFVLRDDNVVNNVACPTKLIEYMTFGTVPIVLSSRIGDFEEIGYEFLEIKKLYNHEFTITQLSVMADKNRQIIKKWNSTIGFEKIKLVNFLRSYL